MGLPQHKEDTYNQQDRKITPAQRKELVKIFLSAKDTTEEIPKVTIQDGANRFVVYKDGAVAAHCPPFELKPSNT